MRLYIQDKENLLKFNLPPKVDGSMLFSFKISGGVTENSLNVDSFNNEWILTSNGSINIIGADGMVVDKIALSDYMSIPILVSGINKIFVLYCLPSIVENSFNFDVTRLNTITIGSAKDNSIVFTKNMMFEHHAVINLENNLWYIYPTSPDEKLYLYVNNQRVREKTLLNVGDIIFTNGLRMIWMKKNFVVPMSHNFFQSNNLFNVDYQSTIKNNEYSPTTELENNITLYSDNQCFTHTPRIRSVLETEEIIIDPPPGKQDQDSNMPFFLSIGSSFTMLGMMSISAFSLYDGLASGTKDFIDILPQIIMVVAMLIGSLLMPILVRKWQKQYAKKREQLRQKKYSNYLLEKEKLIQSKITKQEAIITENNLSLSECILAIKNRNNNFWNRMIKDDDFIELRLGIGNRPSALKIRAAEEKFSLDDDNLFKKVCEVGEKYKELNNVPITISLKEQIVTAIILMNNNKDEFINWLMIQLLTLHSPLDLKIVIFTDSIKENRWDYLKYTNHNFSDDKQTRFFSKNQDEAKILSQFLDNEFNERKSKRDEKQKEINEINKEKVDEYELYDTYFLVITDAYSSIKNFKFFKDLLENQFNYGFSLVIFDENMKSMPNECSKFISITDSTSGMFNAKVTEEDTIKFKAEYATNIDMRTIGRIVANVPVQSNNTSSQLPTSISFLQMYNVGKIEQLNVRNRWKSSDPITSLSAPIGVHTSGELYTLDLHEKADGPHGLIAGSTGSGKSEFIITYILSMALNYDPREVQFVLIDYKGGGLAGAFENREANIAIPHLAGTITNLDTSEMNRTLVSIESELKRRQKQFNKVKEETGESTMDIYKYQRLYREGLIDEPVSHLFIITDEFAELKAQQPEFMAELISTSRIGRSLGVHLILATQKPSGVVNDQIWSNSRFKVCLKVQTRADSMEMLKRPEAASIKETGRFYLQVGYDEYFDIGQSAWTGEKYVPNDRLIKKIDDSISFIDDNGNIIKRSYDSFTKLNENKPELGDQLTNIVKMLCKIAKDDGIKRKNLWLPALEKNIYLKDLLTKYKDKIKQDINPLSNIIFGEYDAPGLQEQGPATFDLLNDGNLLIYGIAGSGKENLISTIIYELTSQMSPNELNIYIGDFGAETLKIFELLQHVGTVFTIEENEKLVNLIKLLNKELGIRKKAYSEFGGNFSSYNKLSGKKDKFILVVLNNYENYLDTYPRMYDSFNPLFRDSAKYGIVFIVSTTQQNAVRMRVAENFRNKVCLKMPNDFDYRDLLGAPKKMVPADNYGRGIMFKDGTNIYEFQTADICNKDEKTQFIREFAKKVKEKYPDIKARKIPYLPEIVYVEDVLFELKGLDCLPIGIERNSLEVYVYNFLEFKINLIAAKSIKNHIYFVYGLIRQMLTLKNVKINIIDALSIYRGNYKNVNVFNNNLEQAFISMYKNVSNDKNLTETNVYIILGIQELKKKVSKYNKNFELLFKEASKCKKNTFLFFDDSNNYKLLQVEDWFIENINNTFGIWLGEDIDTQVALGVMSLSLEEKKVSFPCIGYPIYQGNHMIIKYVVDGVDKKDEQ